MLGNRDVSSTLAGLLNFGARSEFVPFFDLPRLKWLSNSADCTLHIQLLGNINAGFSIAPEKRPSSVLVSRSIMDTFISLNSWPPSTENVHQ